MATYAKDTTVSVERSQAEIRRIFERYKASEFLFGQRDVMATVAFRAQGRNIILPVPMPDRNSSTIKYMPSRSKYDAHGPLRSENSRELAYQQEVRQRWRVLVLLLKAKLESIELGLSTFENEFLAYTMLPSGRTIGQELQGQVDHMMLTGQVPNLLPALRDGRGDA